MIAVIQIAWIAIRELLYERVFYILLCFALLSLGFCLLLGQMTYAEQAKLTLDFMLGVSQISLLLFSVFMGITLFRRELQSGSISMVLSKPVSRTTFLAGKCLGQILVQFILAALMGGLTILVAQYFKPTGVQPIFQTFFLIGCESMVLAGLTYFFSVNTGVITTAILTLVLFAVGHTRDLVSGNLKQGMEASLWSAVRTLTADFSVFDIKQLASYGQSLPWDSFGWAAIYSVLCFGFYLCLACLCFEGKDIPT